MHPDHIQDCQVMEVSAKQACTNHLVCTASCVPALLPVKAAVSLNVATQLTS